MSKNPITPIASDSQGPIAVTYIDMDLAMKAWEEFQVACLEETAATLKRKAAHQRFMAAFMGGEE